MRIQNILALTDFSTPAEHGLDRAATLAATHGARLRVLYVCETPPLQLADPAARLEQRARQLARRHGVPVTAVIGTGRPLDDCLAEAERADLLVAHGRMHRPWPVPPWRTLLYPLLRRCPCPVLVACRPPQGPYARVLVAVDFSAASRPLVRYAGDFETGAALELFHAIDTHDEARLRSAEASTAAVQAYRREVLQYAQERLYRLSNVFDARRNRVGTLIGRGDLARQLTVQQESADADLVVLDPRKEKVISAATQQSAIDYNVFEGKTVRGLPRFVLSRGRVMLGDGALKPAEGHGEFVARPPATPVAKALSTWKALTAPRPVARTGIPASGV